MKLQEIKKLTSLESGIDIGIKSRARQVVYARAIYYKLCREFTMQSLSAIGREVGKDHATVLYGINLFDDVVSEFEMECLKVYDRIKLVIMNTDSDKEKYLSPNIFYKKRYLELEEENRIIRHKFKFLLSQLKLQGNKFTDKKEFQI
jgi:hypothetical protein|tara:strand:+ start:148 stop:588 length:441 start_codon:yes stop_codon:yes gene_type:complete